MGGGRESDEKTYIKGKILAPLRKNYWPRASETYINCLISKFFFKVVKIAYMVPLEKKKRVFGVLFIIYQQKPVSRTERALFFFH